MNESTAEAPRAASPAENSRRALQKKYLPFGLTALLVLAADVASKTWALATLTGLNQGTMLVIPGHLDLRLVHNKGGAWGLLENASEGVRLPFFLIVSIVAVAFILSLYRKVRPDQHALRWALPLVLGGALGNASDRIVRVGVVDFIDYRANWVLGMNRVLGKVAPDWVGVSHWPIFNVADVAICVGVALMAIDMLTNKRGQKSERSVSAPLANSAGEQ
ncbi:MAG TPA: signal peptidase II [Polyangiaceae bacterium]|jgi:signal peptidase II|nr:signal peptidase II [Polyangiaceae bacterium]